MPSRQQKACTAAPALPNTTQQEPTFNNILRAPQQRLLYGGQNQILKLRVGHEPEQGGTVVLERQRVRRPASGGVRSGCVQKEQALTVSGGMRSTHQQVLGRLRFAHQNILHIELQQGTLQDRGHAFS